MLVADIRQDHIQLTGASALLQVSATDEELRLGAERELRGAHMRLRRSRMGFARPGAAEGRRVYRDYTRCMASLRAVCALSGRDAGGPSAAAHAVVADVLGVDVQLLERLRALPTRSADPGRAAAGFSAVLEAAIARVDQLA